MLVVDASVLARRRSPTNPAGDPSRAHGQDDEAGRLVDHHGHHHRDERQRERQHRAADQEPHAPSMAFGYDRGITTAGGRSNGAAYVYGP